MKKGLAFHKAGKVPSPLEAATGETRSGAPIMFPEKQSGYQFNMAHNHVRVGKYQNCYWVWFPPVQVLDYDGKDVTPLPLYHAERGDLPSKTGRPLLDELFSSQGSEYRISASSFNVLSCSSFMDSCRISTTLSLTKDSEDTVLKLDIPLHCFATSEAPKTDNVKQHVTEEMLDKDVNICLAETDTISQLDRINTDISEDADDAQALKERNVEYAEHCKNRLGNDKYVVRLMQTFSAALKNKQSQTDAIAAMDEGTFASICDIHDCYQNKPPESDEKADHPDTSMVTSREKRGQHSSSTVGTDKKNTEYVHPIVYSKSIQRSLLVMEKSIMADKFQTNLAAYRQLPAVEEPDSTVKPGTEEQGEEGSSSPILEHILTFSCKLTRGCNITSMVWNKNNSHLNILCLSSDAVYGKIEGKTMIRSTWDHFKFYSCRLLRGFSTIASLAISHSTCTFCKDILAVSYWDSTNWKPSLICCWCLQNPTWPQRVFHCDSCVTSMEFSGSRPARLAVGMHNGTIAIYDVSQCNVTCITDSSNCLRKPMHPVWQVNWLRQMMTSSGKKKDEVLVSLSADGRISSWLHCGSGLDCLDLIKIKRKDAGLKKTQQILPGAVTPGLCVDFHPKESNIFVVGTWGGLIHRGCISNNRHFLDSYQHHICAVNRIEWSPFSSDVFLSCSSDWTIQLWRKDLLTPVLSFASTQKAVDAVRWSPNCSTIFAAHNEERVEIWNLNSSIWCEGEVPAVYPRDRLCPDWVERRASDRLSDEEPHCWRRQAGKAKVAYVIFCIQAPSPTSRLRQHGRQSAFYETYE
ncbi:dynein axonemal intermediate chain 4-like [Spinachia spinachia]